MSKFSFYSPGEASASVNDLLILIPAGIVSKSELLAFLQSELNFPKYFGHNWDALHEVLADLSWISESEVCLRHEDIPSSHSAEAVRYLRALQGVIELPGAGYSE